MLADISVMMWKEWKELWQMQVSSRSGVIGLLITFVIFGIVMPVQAGATWVESAISLSLWAAIPMLLVGTLVADSFAGERERHTLETLLSSRLPDHAILLGKIFAVVGYVWLVTQLVFVAALVPVNIVHGHGSFLFYRPEVVLSGPALSFLLAALMSNVGVLVSLRAGSVKQAQQTLGISAFVFAYAIPMAVIYGLRLAPKEFVNRLVQPILTGNVGPAALVVSILLVILNVVLFSASRKRFRRDHLSFNE